MVLSDPQRDGRRASGHLRAGAGGGRAAGAADRRAAGPGPGSARAGSARGRGSGRDRPSRSCTAHEARGGGARGCSLRRLARARPGVGRSSSDRAAGLQPRARTRCVHNVRRRRGDGRRASQRPAPPRCGSSTPARSSPPDEVERLLQPFQRLTPGRGGYREGLGLGLSIVAAIAGCARCPARGRARAGASGLEISRPSAARRVRATWRPGRASFNRSHWAWSRRDGADRNLGIFRGPRWSGRPMWGQGGFRTVAP